MDGGQSANYSFHILNITKTQAFVVPLVGHTLSMALAIENLSHNYIGRI